MGPVGEHTDDRSRIPRRQQRRPRLQHVSHIPSVRKRVAEVDTVESGARREAVSGVLVARNVLGERMRGSTEHVERDVEFADTFRKRSELVGEEKVETAVYIFGLHPVYLS